MKNSESHCRNYFCSICDKPTMIVFGEARLCFDCNSFLSARGRMDLADRPPLKIDITLPLGNNFARSQNDRGSNADRSTSLSDS